MKFINISYVHFHLPESSIDWEINFYPRGVDIGPAKLVGFYNMTPQMRNQPKCEVPGEAFRIIRVKCTYRKRPIDYVDRRFKVSDRFINKWNLILYLF